MIRFVVKVADMCNSDPVAGAIFFDAECVDFCSAYRENERNILVINRSIDRRNGVRLVFFAAIAAKHCD